MIAVGLKRNTGPEGRCRRLRQAPTNAPRCAPRRAATAAGCPVAIRPRDTERVIRPGPYPRARDPGDVRTRPRNRRLGPRGVPVSLPELRCVLGLTTAVAAEHGQRAALIAGERCILRPAGRSASSVSPNTAGENPVRVVARIWTVSTHGAPALRTGARGPSPRSSEADAGHWPRQLGAGG